MNITPERCEEIKKQVLAIFPNGWSTPTVTVAPGTVYNNGDRIPGIRIEIGSQYSKPEMPEDLSFLAFLNRLAEITGCQEVNNAGDISNPGCETCDYGSYYAWEFYAFKPVEA